MSLRKFVSSRWRAPPSLPPSLDPSLPPFPHTSVPGIEEEGREGGRESGIKSREDVWCVYVGGERGERREKEGERAGVK